MWSPTANVPENIADIIHKIMDDNASIGLIVNIFKIARDMTIPDIGSEGNIIYVIVLMVPYGDISDTTVTFNHVIDPISLLNSIDKLFEGIRAILTELEHVCNEWGIFENGVIGEISITPDCEEIPHSDELQCIAFSNYDEAKNGLIIDFMSVLSIHKKHINGPWRLIYNDNTEIDIPDMMSVSYVLKNFLLEESL